MLMLSIGYGYVMGMCQNLSDVCEEEEEEAEVILFLHGTYP
jgi:hypothetical protein